MGFSFGGFVAGSLSGRLQQAGVAIAQLYLVAPAAMRFDAEHPLASNTQLTIIQPQDDEVIDPQVVYQWSAALSQPHELLKVADCGHFFHGRLPELKQLVAFLESPVIRKYYAANPHMANLLAQKLVDATRADVQARTKEFDTRAARIVGGTTSRTGTGTPARK